MMIPISEDAEDTASTSASPRCQTENKAKQNRAVRKHGCHGDSFFQGKKALEALTDM